MNKMVRFISAFSVIVVGGAIHSAAHAEYKPRVLRQSAYVLNAIECTAPCSPPVPHTHKDFEEWDVKANKTTFEIHRKIAPKRPHFFDLPWNFWNRMQKPDLHLINGHADPLSAETFGFTNKFDASLLLQPEAAEDVARNYRSDIVIKDFLFLFDIYNLTNADGTRTPHAIIYVPFRRGLDLPKELADRFVLLVFHIPDHDLDCDREPQEFLKDHCLLLRRLSAAWNSANYTYDGLTEEARRQYREYFDHLFDPFGAAVAPATKNGQRFAAIAAVAFRILLHNGIIHGTLGGG